MIRALAAADAEAVAAVIRAAFGSVAPLLDPAPSALRETAASVLPQIEAGGGAGWDEGGLVGCVLWREEAGGLYIGRLSVLPGCAGRGIGRALIADAEAEARRRGLGRLRLAVRLALAGNRRLFAAMGFVEGAMHAHDGYAAPTFVDAEKVLS